MRVNWRKAWLVVAAGIVLALLVLTSDRYLPGVPKQPERLPPAVVTLGDSMVSGEGAGNYNPSTDGAEGNWCHRSPDATVHQISVPEQVTTINLACSGAQADAVSADPDDDASEQSQAAELARLAQRYRITDVVVQVGANDDPGFTDVVNRCVQAWGNRAQHGCAGQLRANWPDRVERMKPKVVDALQDVRAAMDSAGYTPRGYSLVLQSYASPVGPGVDPSLQNLSGCPFLPSDLRWIRERAVPELSTGLREVADETNARFLDFAQAGVGHEACTGDPQTGRGEWFTRLTVDWRGLQDQARSEHAMQESFHANSAGYTEFGRCLGRFLNGDAQHAMCLPDEGGSLTPKHANTDRNRP